jgi:hypothetical protein
MTGKGHGLFNNVIPGHLGPQPYFHVYVLYYVLYRQLADFEQWKLMSSGMAIFFDADFSMGNYRP